MYLVISWDISAVNPRWSQINEQMVKCLSAYPTVKPVNTFYLVRVTSAPAIKTIQACFEAVVQRTTEPITFVISPVLTDHPWSGRVNDWVSVNAITKP